MRVVKQLPDCVQKCAHNARKCQSYYCHAYPQYRIRRDRELCLQNLLAKWLPDLSYGKKCHHHFSRYTLLIQFKVNFFFKEACVFFPQSEIRSTRTSGFVLQCGLYAVFRYIDACQQFQREVIKIHFEFLSRGILRNSSCSLTTGHFVYLRP